MRAALILPVIFVLGAVVVSSVFIVDERKQALVLQFGQVKQVKEAPGLGFKIPLIQEVVRYDGRILGVIAPVVISNGLGQTHQFIGGFGFGDRLRLVIRAEEARDLGGVLDEVVDVVGHRQLGEDIARHELAFDLDLLAALDLGHRLGRNLDGLDRFGKAQTLGLGDDRIADLVLETGIGVDDVPTSHMCACLSVFAQASDSSQRITAPKAESIPRKKSERITIMIPTKIAVRTVSSRLGQTTLRPSART